MRAKSCRGPRRPLDSQRPAPAHRSRHRHSKGCATGAALLTAAVIGGCATQATNRTAQTTNPLATQPPSVQWVSDPESDSTDTVSSLSISLVGDGVFRVGTDLTPGIYHSAGPRATTPCSWQRLSAATTSGSAVIESGIGTGPQYLTIEPTDAAFLSQSCQPWRRTG
jgi:hypothetical protein